jgi:hypothetical protein
LWAILSWAAFNFQPATYTYRGDFWEHSAALQAWLQDLWNPTNPHFASDVGSPRYIPFYFVITALSIPIGLTALQAMGIAGVVSVTLFVVGIKLFSDRYFCNPWAAPIALLVFLTGWGNALIWANVYQLRNILYVISYPSFFVFSFGFIAYWWVLGLIKSETLSLWKLIVLALMVSVMFSSHPPTGVAIAVTMGLMITLAEDVRLGRRVALVVVLFAGSLLVELWPYFSTWQIVLGTSTGHPSWVATPTLGTVERAETIYWSRPFYQPRVILISFGPALLGVPILLYLVARERKWFLLAGCAIFSIPYLLNFFISVPLGDRFILFVLFFLHLSMIWFFLKVILGEGYSVWMRYAGIGLLSVMALWNVGLAAVEFSGYSFRGDLKPFKQERMVVGHMQAVANVVPSDAVIMAPVALGWPLPTFGGKVVGGLHPFPMVRDAHQRRKDVEAFFSAGTTLQDRKRIMERYQVTHVLYDTKDAAPELTRELSVIPGLRTGIYDLMLITLPDAN